jgi:hypothetical protein
MSSTLALKWTDRVLSGSQTPRRFLDFMVGENPLYPTMGDRITPLGWLGSDLERKAVYRLLRKEPSDFPENRNSIYICPECAQLDCGAVTVVIERVGDDIVWRDFGIQNDSHETVYRNDFDDIGPFYFNATEYFWVISSAFDAKDEQ